MATQIRIPFGVDAYGAMAVVSDDRETDKLNLITLVGTQPGERAMRPAYGVATGGLLFEDAELLAQELATEIRDAVALYAPEISLVDLQVTLDDGGGPYDGGHVEVAMSYAAGAGRLNTGVGVVSTTVAVGG